MDYEEAINLQGYWGHSPETPLVDLQAENKTHTQQELPSVVEETIHTSMYM
jgi:hypothetical protein